MPVYPHAIWKPVTGHTNGPMHSYTGVVLHCNDAQSIDLHDWIMSNPDGMSCHFQVTKAGAVYQYLDTRYSSWCQKDGNNDYLSIESQGLASERATDAQVDAIGRVLAWLHTTHGIPLQLANAPGQRGFGWHGMGAAAGADWGHAACPGVRKDQRPSMLVAAAGNSTQLEDDDMYDAAEKKALFARLDHIDSVMEHDRSLLTQEIRNARAGTTAAIKASIVAQQTALEHDISTVVAGGGDPKAIAATIANLLIERLAS